LVVLSLPSTVHSTYDEQVGKTVLVAEERSDEGGYDGFWIEGLSDEAVCPLRDVSPLSNPFSSGTLLGDVGAETANLASELRNTWSKIEEADKKQSREGLREAFESGLDELGKTKESIASRVSSMSAEDALSVIGLDKKFVAGEMQLVESLAQGKAVVHHLEPSYFVAMTKALDYEQTQDVADAQARDPGQASEAA